MQTKIKKNNQPKKKGNRKHKDFMVPEQRTESRDAWAGTRLAGAQRGSAELPADLSLPEHHAGMGHIPLSWI